MAYDPHNHLEGVHPKLVAVVARCAETYPHFTVIEGVRSALRQAQLYAQGRTAPGKKVTWVKVSNHQAKPDGYGHAVDLGVLKPDGSIEWNSAAAYAELSKHMFEAAGELGVHLRTGADWNENGIRGEHGETDLDHFEIVL